MQDVVEVSRALEKSIASLVSCFSVLLSYALSINGSKFMPVNQYSTSP